MKTALVIEDNAEIRENTLEILELAGFAVHTAINGKEGVQAAIQHQPQVILCDIMMPEMSGYEVINALKSNPVTASIPFIYVTASTEKSDVQRALAMGADGYVRKPFDAHELIEAIQKILE